MYVVFVYFIVFNYWYYLIEFIFRRDDKKIKLL